MNKPLAIAIVGPTCSGKTEVSIELSKLLNAEIISADSRQIYRYLTIGTAKPSQLELQKCPHHFIDILNPDEPFSAGMFANSALGVVNDIFTRNKTPIIVGGSGLYISALCEGMFNEQSNAKILIHRNELERRLTLEGKSSLYNELIKIDPISAQKYNDQNPRRIIRALEYYYANGTLFSEAHRNKSYLEIPFQTLYFGIELERTLLYNRINQRCLDMWENGLVEETKKILNMGYSPQLNSLNTVGYKEAIAYISSKYTKEQAIEKMQQSTRNYAKRQLTWFRKNSNIIWLYGTSQQIANEIFMQYSQIYK